MSRSRPQDAGGLHPMKNHGLTLVTLVVIAIASLIAGCGDKAAEERANNMEKEIMNQRAGMKNGAPPPTGTK